MAQGSEELVLLGQNQALSVCVSREYEGTPDPAAHSCLPALTGLIPEHTGHTRALLSLHPQLYVSIKDDTAGAIVTTDKGCREVQGQCSW